MKLILLSLTLTLSSVASAAVDGLSCKMQYSTTDAFSTAGPASDTRWLVKGGEMAGPAYSKEGGYEDGSVGPANFLVVSTEEIAGKSYWKLYVLDGDKNTIGSFSFKEDETYLQNPSSMKAVVPVTAFGPGDEDPTEYKILEISCYNTVFAG